MPRCDLIYDITPFISRPHFCAISTAICLCLRTTNLHNTRCSVIKISEQRILGRTEYQSYGRLRLLYGGNLESMKLMTTTVYESIILGNVAVQNRAERMV